MSWSTRARALMQNVWTFHQGEMMRLERARMAKAANLDPDNYALPYPQTSHVSIQEGSAAGLLKGALLSAALLGTGGGGALALLHGLGLLNQQPAAPAVPAPQPPPPVAPPPRPLRYRITIRAANGQVLHTEDVSDEMDAQAPHAP